MAQLRAIAQPHGAGSVGAELLAALADARWRTFRCAVAFAKRSGIRHIASPLHSFASRAGNTAQVSVGISSQGTSLEGLQDLWRLLDGRGDLYVFHEGAGIQSSFHPKTYLFRNKTDALVIVGSSNFTEGGLFINHEISTVAELSLAKGSPDNAYLSAIETRLDAWQTPGATCMHVDPALLQSLHDQGDLPSEATLSVVRRAARVALGKRNATASGTTSQVKFGSSGVPRAPAPTAFPKGLPTGPVTPTTPTPGPPTVHGPPLRPVAPPAAPVTARSLYMEVRPHDNGEVFLSYRAILEDPAFFGHPFSGWTTPRASGASPYPMATPDPVVDIFVYDTSGRVLRDKRSHALNMVDYERKHEIRVTMPDRVQDSIPVMSLLVMTKDPAPTLDYRLEFHPPGSARATALEPQLTKTLPSGGAGVGRRYGWS